MSKLDKALFKLQDMEIHTDETPCLDARVGIFVTLLYLVLMLSVPLSRPSTLIWMALYPIIASTWLGIGFTQVFLRSLIVLPIVVIIGMFNPIFEQTEVFSVSGISITEGWISFISVTLRGLLAMQCVLILIETNGFLGICRGLSKLGVPRFLTQQLQFVYRYMIILLEEALTMKRAREARGYGRRKYPLKTWGVMIGQLFLRAIDRSERIARSMEARGFNGNLPEYYFAAGSKLSAKSIFYLVFWIIGLPLLRFLDLSSLFFS